MNQIETDGLELIDSINNSEQEQTEILLKINTDLDNINEHISSLDDYLVIKKIEKEKNEQEYKKEVTKNTEEKAETKESEITIENVYSEIQTTNSLLETNNNIGYVSVFSNGILIGVLLFTLFWNRVFK